MSVWNDFSRVIGEQKAGIEYRARDLWNEICRRRALEDILVLEFSNYGPIVAIGDPRHKTRYFGAARDFYECEDWRQAVVEHMRKSRAIIIALDETEGVGWELETLAREGLLEKTLLLCPARFQPRDGNRQLWRHVRERLSRGRPDAAGTRDLDQGADPRDPVLACWTLRMVGTASRPRKSFPTTVITSRCVGSFAAAGAKRRRCDDGRGRGRHRG